MITADVNIEKADVQKLLATASGDAAMLYIYLKSGNDPERAEEALRMNHTRMTCAAATLRQLGLWQEEKKTYVPGERPAYSEADVIQAMETDRDFRNLFGEVQRQLGRPLNTEEMKIILGFVHYLGLPGDVICVLIHYCIDRARKKGNLYRPSLRTIEREAYAWADRGIDTMEEAAAFIQAQNFRNSQLGELMHRLQIHGRKLTPGEEKYAVKWLEAGFDMDVIAMAYERTCLNTGGLNWAYMNKILARWKEAGLLTAEQVKNGDKKPTTPVGAAGGLGEAELANIKRLLGEGK